MVTEKQLQQALRQTTEDTSRLLDFCISEYGKPVDALMAMVLGAGSLAATLGMSKAALLEGVGLAYDTHVDGEGPDHVH